MTASAVTETVVDAAPQPTTRRYATRGQINQVLTFNFCNGDRAAARVKFNSLTGVRPAWNDPHAKHRDRELFVVEDVAWQLYPNNVECREKFLAVNFEPYAKGVDKTAIQHFPALSAA